MREIIRSGFKIVKIGWERSVIGEKPLPYPDRSDYSPFRKPEKIWSEPKRWIEINTIGFDYDSPKQVVRIWDDGSSEFNYLFHWFEGEDMRIMQAKYNFLKQVLGE